MAAAPIGRGKRVLVTGGAGFLGSHLCESLVKDGYDVICVDNFFTGLRSNVAHLTRFPNFELVRWDVTEPLTMFSGIDEIYNLACPASPPHYQFDPVGTTRTCVLGAMNVLDLAHRCRARILQASTSEVYGDPTEGHHPQVEDYRGNVNPIGVRACYDEGKRCAESLFFDYHRSRGVDIVVVRIFNTYGPRMHPQDGRVITNFITQAIGGVGPTLYGEGKQTRSFCYVDDLIAGFRAAMRKGAGFTGPVNLGNPHEVTVAEVADLVRAHFPACPAPTYLPLPGDDPKQRRPDISYAEKELGWRPTVPLETGLLRTIEYFKSIDLAEYRAPTSQTAHEATEKATKLLGSKKGC